MWCIYEKVVKIQITVIFDESLYGPCPCMMLFCDEHRNTAPWSSLVTVYVTSTWMNSVQFSVLTDVALDAYINSGVSLFWDIFQIVRVPRELPTSATVHIKCMDWFSSSSFGNNKNLSCSFGFAKTIKGIHIDKLTIFNLSMEKKSSFKTSKKGIPICTCTLKINYML